MGRLRPPAASLAVKPENIEPVDFGDLGTAQRPGQGVGADVQRQSFTAGGLSFGIG